VIQAPIERLPDKTAPLSDRVTALLNWSESAGPGLKTVQETLNQLLDKETPPLPTICPYKGLSYFDCNDRDHQFFYGREALTQALLAKLERDSFLAIVGASGSGKSSVLRAGVLQRLKNTGNTEIRLLVPGEHPLQSLALAFVDETAERLDRAEQQQQAKRLVESGAEGLCALVATSNEPHVVLVVDQFEESFTLCQDRAEREKFFAMLLGALRASDTLTLILAMRSDFVGKCFEADYSGLATQVKTHLEPVLPMSQEELTQAITAPARQVGLTLEPGLVEALLKDVDPTSGSLPLLQYTLTEVWQRQQDHQLKLSAYMQLGGVTGTLQQRADTVYDSLTPKQQHTAKHIFLSLTQLGEGAEDTRRRLTQASLISAQHPEAQVTAVIKRLADANLVVTDDRTLDNSQSTATIDVAHESLIRSWPKLRHWLSQNRSRLLQRNKLEEAAISWSNEGKKAGFLYGMALTSAVSFKADTSSTIKLSKLGEEFIEACQRNRRKVLSKLIIALTLSFVGIQIIILVPSVMRRERELLEYLRALSTAQAEGVLGAQAGMADADDAEVLTRLETLLSNDVILGGALYRADGTLIDTFGEPPDLGNPITLEEGQGEVRRDRYNRQTQRYDAVWEMSPLEGRYELVIRHDATWVGREFYFFIARITGLVLIISV
ncbi:MAG: ATP-binding protein, partial [Cyanobacteria bacterium P01_D01_bin.115]